LRGLGAKGRLGAVAAFRVRNRKDASLGGDDHLSGASPHGSAKNIGETTRSTENQLNVSQVILYTTSNCVDFAVIVLCFIGSM